MRSSYPYIFIVLLWIFASKSSFGQLEASGDTTICKGGQAQLYATGGGASYNWSSFPTDPSLLIPQQQNPIVSPQVTTMYVVQSNIATGNLILNGSFSLGVMGFNSEYVNNQVSIVAEGTYAVVNDAHTVHPNFYCNEDHTTGSGKFMAINGAGVANVKVWYLTLTNVQPEARYEFSTWITSLHPTNPATLQFSINGQLMGSPFQAYPYTCDWYQFFHIWDADTNHQATISIVNQNTILSGNDFALDDISFATVLVYYDTVWVEVLPQFNSPFNSPATACSQEVITVEYTGNAPDTAIFNWDFGTASVLSGNGPGPYEIVHTASGNNVISLWVDGEGCPSDTTTHPLLIGESPDVTVSADNTILPYGSSTYLHGSYSGGIGPFEFEWSPQEFLTNPSILDPQTIAMEYSTYFILAVTDLAANCTGYDTIWIQVAGGPLGVSLQAVPEEICVEGQSVITAQGLGGTENYTYSWVSIPPGFTSDLPVITVQPSITTEYTVTIDDGLSQISESVSVAVNPDPIAFAGTDKVIPYGTSTSLQGTGTGGSGNYSYQWDPASLVINPNSSSTQTVNLTSTTIFTLSVNDLVTGCLAEPDEIIVEVDGGPLAVIIDSDKPTLCIGESAVLTAYANGGNQGNYTYEWSDNMGNTYPQVQQINVSPGSTLTFHVIADDGFNQVEAYLELIVYPSSTFEWMGGQDNIIACPYDSVMLQPLPNPTDWSYLWSNGSDENQISVGATGIGYSQQTYTLTTTTPDGCSFTKTAQVIFDFSYCFGIDEKDPGEAFRVSPNPGDGKFTVEIDHPGEFKLLTVYSQVSGKVFEKTINPDEHTIYIDIHNMPDGIYVIALKSPFQLVSRKVLLIR